MRELTSLDTGYLAGLLVLSLVLPVMMSLRRPHIETVRRSCLKTVWAGQVLCAIAGVVVLASATFAPYAATFGLASCTWCVFTLRRQFRTAPVS
jgi:hypothetical protein